NSAEAAFAARELHHDLEYEVGVPSELGDVTNAQVQNAGRRLDGVNPLIAAGTGRVRRGLLRMRPCRGFRQSSQTVQQRPAAIGAPVRASLARSSDFARLRPMSDRPAPARSPVRAANAPSETRPPHPWTIPAP